MIDKELAEVISKKFRPKNLISSQVKSYTNCRSALLNDLEKHLVEPGSEYQFEVSKEYLGVFIEILQDNLVSDIYDIVQLSENTFSAKNKDLSEGLW